MTRSARPGGVMIEFFGMPGVGKTTLARGVVADLRRHGYDAAFLAMDAPRDLNRYLKLASQIGVAARYAATRPRQALSVTRVLGHFPQPDLITLAKVTRYWLLTCAMIDRSACQADVVVCDQGFYQGLFALALLTPAPDQAAFCAALRLFPMPDFAVLITADLETIRTRLNGRAYDHRWIDKLLRADRAAAERGVEIIEHIAAALRIADRLIIAYSSAPTAPVSVDTQKVAAMVRGHLQRPAGITVARAGCGR
jgi:thymidylate kinase